MTTLLERWTVRADDASVAFRGKASRFTPTVQARFTSVSGTVSAQRVEVDVDVRSMTTGNRTWDELLVAADPFDAGRHPIATYCSDDVLWVGSRAVVTGALRLRGRTSLVRLDAARMEVADGVARLRARGRVDPRPFGLRLAVPGCGAFLPARLDLTIDVTVERS